MMEVTGDLWSYPADAMVIPTNGSVRKDGTAIMGAGVAKEAARRWPDLPDRLGQDIREEGVRVAVLLQDDVYVVAFPTKISPWQKSRLDLIETGARDLAKLSSRRWTNWETVVLPRVGCGLGGLDWEDVKPVLSRYLDDRFVAVTK